MTSFSASASYLRELSRKGGPNPDEYPELLGVFASIMRSVRDGAVGGQVLPELWPTLGDAFWSTWTVQGVGILKPHGYAGDFEMMDRLYTYWLSSREDLVRWDRFLQAQPAVTAVRSRKAYFLSHLRELIAKQAYREFRIASVGCGPARECLEFLESGSLNGPDVSFDCVDQDSAALQYAAGLLGDTSGRVSFIHRNAFKWEPRESWYDLVWAAGLFDYLTDSQFQFLLRHLAVAVRAGGMVVVGNFSPANPTRDYMEFGHWILNYRTEDQLYGLARAALPTQPAELTWVDREPEGINLFLHVQKPDDG